MSLTVLLVDDNGQVRNSGKQTLEIAGYTVICCETGEQALKRITRDCGVLITDLRMPGMDGFTLMERALSIDPDLPVIMITGHGDVSTAIRAIRGGAYDFIEKPYPVEIFVETVRRALERRSLFIENRLLKEELLRAGDDSIIGRSPAIEHMRAIIATIAQTDTDVLVMGETGTGKELVARALHQQSARRSHKFVAINCGAMPDSLFESELFGHEAGTFTNAAKRRIGRIQFADKGTVFLDEIESLALPLQVKLLRVLQERAVEPLGSNEVVPVDIRVVAATKTSLKQASIEKNFREDLYYRLNVVMIQIPPLRERREDISLLFQHFVLDAAKHHGRDAPKLTPTLLSRLVAYSWPGNVRELKNAAERFVLGVTENHSVIDDEITVRDRHVLSEQMDSFEKILIEAELTQHHGNVKNTIESLGISRKTLYDKLHRLGISVDNFR